MGPIISAIPFCYAGTSDFMGLNHYTSHYSYHNPNPDSEPNFDADKDTGGDIDPSWPR